MKEIRIIRIVLLAAALVMLTAGLYSGGMMDVWTRAAMICLECIGIG